MKRWFAAGLVALAVFYTIYGQMTLTLFGPAGRPAAGFFPLVLGVLLIAATALNLWRDVKERDPKIAEITAPEGSGEKTVVGGLVHQTTVEQQNKRDVLVVFVYICGFVAIMPALGALMSMVVFMLAFLFTFNRRHVLSNLIYSALLPGFLYGLFKVLLNSSLPVGPLGV